MKLILLPGFIQYHIKYAGGVYTLNSDYVLYIDTEGWLVIIDSAFEKNDAKRIKYHQNERTLWARSHTLRTRIVTGQTKSHHIQVQDP